MSELTPLVQALLSTGTGLISIAVLVLVWRVASAVTAWAHTLNALGIDLVKIEKSNASGHVEIKLAIGRVDTKVDHVGDRVTDLERGVREANDAKR